MDGQPVALDGDLLACGCHLRSTVQRLVYVEAAPAPAKEDVAGPAVVCAPAAASSAPPVCLGCLMDAARSGTPMVRLE
ncbi:hypothetical protein [Stenotrophomonas sp.]|uniref:hypothetical protein n=1 Tax=Stenotrophomonas sp. TaxID=69392 RepID=UPI0028AD4E2A|nr:hypothetical protein [Stenotrophomonas sp.]